MFNNEKQRFSLRKLSVGLASVCIGITFISVKQDTVKADTIDAKTNIVTAQSVNPDVQKADTQKELLKNTDTQDGVKQTEQIDKTSDSNTPSDQATNGVAKENLAVSEQLENKENNVNNINVKRQNELHVSTGDNQLNTTHENKQALETSLLKDTTKPETTNTFHVRKSNMQANVNALRESKAVVPNSNGGFDEATWGKLDVNNWQGSVQDDVYELTKYTGDPSHVIVPNEADFEQAGKSTNGLQVGITRDTVLSFLSNRAQTIAFSKTKGEKVKAIGTDWSWAFSSSALSKFDGSSLDVSGVTNMERMFMRDSISDLTSLTNWDTSSVTDMSGMFFNNSISDLRPLINWKTSNVTDMSEMFGGFAHDVIFDESAASDGGNSISDLAPLTKWDVSNVTDMRGMFTDNKISNLTGLANWNIGKVTNMTGMFVDNSISDLTPLAHWNTSGVTDMQAMFADNKISDLSPLANWKTSSVTNMSGMFSNSKRKFMPDGSVVFIDGNSISDLAPLTNWDVGNVTDMSRMFAGNKISNLTGLKNWNVSNVTDMSEMFAGNKISNLTGLANWKTGNVTDMGAMFAGNPDLIDLKSIANWNISDINDYYGSGFSGLFIGDTKLDLTNINNTPLMQNFLKKPRTLCSTTFITNNADLVKKLVDQEGMLVDQEGQELPIFTKTAKRTIVFHFPDGTQKEIDQIINFKTFAPVQIEWPAPTDGGIEAMVLAFASEIQPFASERQPFVSERPPFVGERPSFVGERPPFASVRQSFASIRQPVQSAIPRIIKTYTIEDVKASDWQLDDSKQNDDVIIDGVICFKPVKIPHVNGYKAYLMKDPVNPAMFLVSFVALPQQLQNNQSNNVQLPQKPAQPEQKQPEQKQPEQKQSEQKQSEQKQSEQKQSEQKQPEQKQPEQNIESNDLTWRIDNNLNNNVSYNLTNTIYKLRLPKFTNYSLRLVKRGTTQNSISFVYTNKTQKLDYVFNLKIQDNKYYLTVGKIDHVNRKIIPIKTYNVISYQDLLQIIAKYFK